MPEANSGVDGAVGEIALGEGHARGFCLGLDGPLVPDGLDISGTAEHE